MPKALMASACVGALAVAGLAGCGRPGVADSPQVAASSPQGSLVRVTAAVPERKTIRVVTVQPARIEPFEVTPLYPKISGYVRDIQVDIGDSVDEGALLLSIWIPEMDHELAQKDALVGQAEAEVAQAAAAVRAARAAVGTARSLVAVAEAGLDRADGEYQMRLEEHRRTSELTDRGSLSDRLLVERRNQLTAATAGRREEQARIEAASAALEESQARLAKSEADETAARARLKVAEADRDRMQALLAYTRIVAPFPGVVTQRNIDTGHLVQPSGGTVKPLLVVARNDKLRVVVEVPEAEAALVSRGDAATIRVPALRGREIPGEVVRTSWALEASNRTLRTEIDLENDDGLLRPGTYATVRIELEEQADALVLPAAALVYEDGQTLCCCVENGRIARRPITTGLRSGNDVEIVSGLAGNELVVQARGESLTEGQAVELLAPAGT